MRLALAALLFAACASPPRPYPGCVTTAGVEVCAIPDREEVEAATAARAWVEVYAEEWGRADAERVVAETRIVMGPIEDMPHPCATDAAGCFVHWLNPQEAWVSTRHADGSQMEPCRGALAHELVHAAEYLLEQRIDYEHDDRPHRWGEMLQRAKARCEEMIQ